MTDLVLLHGGKHGSWCWEPLTRVMEAQANPFARTIALDMPGCGRKRDRDPEGLSLADIARELNGESRSAGTRRSAGGAFHCRCATADDGGRRP